MRFLERKSHGKLCLTRDLIDNIPKYAILSHTWGDDGDEVTFQDMVQSVAISKVGYKKIMFCMKQAIKDGLQYIWVDTCCIDKSNNTELSEAINSMFRWYREATKCYVYLSDVSKKDSNNSNFNYEATWASNFAESRWFTRGWTLQELIAPVSVGFFSKEGKYLGDKESLVEQLHKITGVPVAALQGDPLSHFAVSERISWADNRETKRKEDKAYSLMGLFGIHMPLIYGEGRDNAFMRLCDEVNKHARSKTISIDDLYKQDQSRTCLGSLAPADQGVLQNRAMARNKSACEWFLNESRFQEWRTDCRSDLLYITANAGCGKTTIAAHVIDALQCKRTVDASQNQDRRDRKDKKDILLYFFFQKINVDDEGTATAAMRTIISQLVHQMPDLYQLLQRQYDILALKGHVSWSWEPLLSVFLGMVQQIRERTVSITYIVLDGIDECSSDSRSSLLTCLYSLVEDQRDTNMDQLESALKILITGRPDEEVFVNIPNLKHFEITDNLTANDINALIVTGMEQLGNRRHLGSEVQSSIKKFLHTNAKGMFLWVVLVLQELDRRDERLTNDLIVERLRKVPLTLASVYEEILENVPETRRDDMWRILRCMLISFRVMSLIELKAALCVELGISEWHDFPGDVKRLCGSLVRITNDKAGFVHQSAQDFLEAYLYRGSTEQLHKNQWHFEEAKLQITIVCLKYLLQDGLLVEVHHTYESRTRNVTYRDRMHNVLKKWPFLGYAGEYWAPHLRSLAQLNTNITPFTCELLDIQMNRTTLMKLNYFLTRDGSSGSPGWGTQLHIAAYFDLPWIIAEYIHKQQAAVNEKAEFSATALVWGSEMGSTRSIKLLLQTGADPNIVEYDGWSALHWAATNGHVEICTLLMEHGADVGALDSRRRTPRAWAIYRGHVRAAAEIQRFSAKNGTSNGIDCEGEHEDVLKSKLPNTLREWLDNGRMAMGTCPHQHGTAQD